MIRKVVRASRRVRAASIDIDQFRARHKKAQEKRNSKKDPVAIINQIRESDNPLETAFELLVPDSGKADTVAGELMRAMNRIMYRDMNDGDVFYEGYGIETCGDCVAYICDKIPQLEQDFEDIAMRMLTDRSYTRALEDISEKLLEYLYEDPDLVSTKNTEDMYDFDGQSFMEEHEWIPEYEFSGQTSYEVDQHVEAGNISYRDIQNEIAYNWDIGDGDVYVNPNGDVSITGLDRETFDQLEQYFDSYMNQYADELDTEFGPVDEDEYDDDEYDED